MESTSLFEPGDRVALCHDLKPYRNRHRVLPRDSAGTVTAVFHNVAYVDFDGFDHTVAVRLTDIDLLNTDERVTLALGYWPVAPAGGSDVA